MNIWIAFIFYLIYLFFRFLFHSFQKKIIWYFNGVNDHLAKLTFFDSSKTCQLLKIVYRKTLVEGEIANPNDFVWWHDKFVDPNDLLTFDSRWTLYTVDKEFVYLVLMPHPIFYYHSRETAYLNSSQFAEGVKLARMPLKCFCRFTEKYLNDPKGLVVYNSSGARCGSTLLIRVMQVSQEKVICIGDPCVFTALSMLHERKFLTDALTMDLLKASIKFFCKHQLPDQTYILKPPSNGCRMVPLIKKAMPRVKHFFLFRRNTRRVLSSLEKATKVATPGVVLIWLWNINSELACQLLSLAPYTYKMCLRFGPPKDCLDYCILGHVDWFYQCYTNRHIFDLPVIYYEDLVSEKEATLRKLFDLCQLPYQELIGEALQEFNKDSQAGINLSQENMKLIQDAVVDEARVKRMNDVCDQLNIPHLEI